MRGIPEVAEVRFADLGLILARGLADLARAPLLSIAIAALYTLGGWLLIALLVHFRLLYLVYPLAMGFALVAPFVAVAFYAVAHRLEEASAPGFVDVWCTVCETARRDLRWMALFTSFAFFIWMDLAAMLVLTFFGASALDFATLITEITTTQDGLVFLVIGHAVGAVIALLVFSVSAVSFPMLYHRDVDTLTAMITSVRLVRKSPVVMASWCAIIAILIGLSVASGLTALPVVLPVLGYATWHLYRMKVAPA